VNEVSCRVFDVFEKPLRAKGLSFDDIVKDTNVPAAKLRGKKERLDWGDFAAVMRNMRPVFSDDEYVAIGRVTLQIAFQRLSMNLDSIQLALEIFLQFGQRPDQVVAFALAFCFLNVVFLCGSGLLRRQQRGEG